MGCTALCYAAEGKQEAMVALLLARGADVNSVCRSSYARTPLGHAVYGRHNSTVHLLLTEGADVEKAGAVLVTLDIEHDKSMMRALLQAGADIDARHPGYDDDTGLVVSAKNGRRRTVEFLLEAGANINLQHRNDFALYAAARCGNEEIVRRLLLWGADTQGIPAETWLQKALKGSERRAKIGEGQNGWQFQSRRNFKDHESWIIASDGWDSM